MNICYQVYFSAIIGLQLTEAHTDASRSNKDQFLLNLRFSPHPMEQTRPSVRQEQLLLYSVA